MKKQAILFIILHLVLHMSAQDNKSTVRAGNKYLQLIYHSGIYWSRTEYLAQQFERGYKALEARFGIQTTGQQLWQQYHNYPRYGVGMHYADLVADRKDTIVGNPFSAFAFYGAPWARVGRFTLNSDLSVGLSYASVIHDPVLNPYNDVIASHINLYFDFNMNLYCRLTNRIDLNAGYGVTHYSNGRIHQPQKGVNNWGWTFGLSYQLNKTRPEWIENERPEFNWESELQLMYAAGVVEEHRLGDFEGIHYYTSSFTVDYVFTFNPRMALGIGTDILYDGSLARAIKGIAPEDVTTFQKFYFGSHMGYHFIIDRVTILFNLGTYFYQHSYDRGYWFLRAGGRIRLTDHLHTQICIKTKNGVRADWIEWGVATSFKIR